MKCSADLRPEAGGYLRGLADVIFRPPKYHERVAGEMYEFSKLDNFRDLGGMKTQDGRTVAPKRLLRAGELSKVTAEDVKILTDMFRLSNIIDLRTENEKKASPDVEIPETNYIALDFFEGEDKGQATGSAEQLKQMQNVEQIHQMMKKLYASFITSEKVRRKLYEFLQILLRTTKGATIFHCFAGKDRTGISAAVILTVLGVSKENIMADYLKTNVLRRRANEEVLAQLKAVNAAKEIQEAVGAALCVEREYLEICYETAEKEYGSFGQYISEGIGLQADEWEKLQDMYLY